ncbi:hypothetical protein P344_01925 [Spiroplasma mirum ATCC 29335]|uniref:Uncharacterized protein n=1 Tax=Spiroplasma mirum ATCC 29335 TaxID=838561 RepID=W0GNY2_9MOLU|nr:MULTISPECIES: hypothetical protein [Spiroplasma]AHF60773.1 hypothetical protein SMM_0322 [Spiroplasma mirum ATCC 29335]AHI57733.1 hypothetical protein P344_01925 [Spiroplasma mirum ATCC 29335]
MIFSVLLIIGLFVGLQYLYIYINNLLYIKYKGQTLNKTVNEKIFGIKENSVSNPLPIISFEPEIAEQDDSSFFLPPSNP